ncbi:MAG: hypothetical protein ABWK15_06550 [Dissulfuribacterales bacterium]
MNTHQSETTYNNYNNRQTSIVLPPMPDSFWRKTDELMEFWMGLSMLLDQEWEQIKRNDLLKLWDIQAKKRKMAEMIDLTERRFSLTIETLLKACGVKTVEHYTMLDVFKQYIDHADIDRFTRWLVAYRMIKQEVTDRNRRHALWLEDQARLTKDLVAILTARHREAKPTYTPAAYGRPTQRMQPAYKKEVV